MCPCVQLQLACLNKFVKLKLAWMENTLKTLKMYTFVKKAVQLQKKTYLIRRYFFVFVGSKCVLLRHD